MAIAYFPLIVALIGLLMFFVSPNTKVMETGKIMFWTGLLVTLFTVAQKIIRLT
jgi:hypothetical protein